MKTPYCPHNEMVRNDSPIHVWKCAQCGHVFGALPELVDWKVMPDPARKGLHPVHDHRHVATADASWEDAYHPGEFKLEGGNLICDLRDTLQQRDDAHIIASAPAALRACYAVLLWAKTGCEHGGNPYLKEFVRLAERAIAQRERREPESYARKS